MAFGLPYHIIIYVLSLKWKVIIKGIAYKENRFILDLREKHSKQTTRFLGPSRKSIVNYNLTDRTKFMILFHLQRLATEHHSLVY